MLLVTLSYVFSIIMLLKINFSHLNKIVKTFSVGYYILVFDTLNTFCLLCPFLLTFCVYANLELRFG